MWTLPTNHTFDDLIAAIAGQVGTDPALVKAHCARESAFNPQAIATDPNGVTQSYGLMQLELATAHGLGYTGGAPTVTDQVNETGLYDRATNLALGAALIAKNLQEALTVDDAISAYNAGFSLLFPGKGQRKPDLTYVNQGYVDDVRAAYAAYQGDFVNGAPAQAGRRGLILMAVLYTLAVAGVVLVWALV